jgi:hypothetical protein
MIKFGLNPSMKFGVVGIGGLGHMAVKFGKVSDLLNEGERKRSACMIQIDAVCVHTRLTGCHGDLITNSGGL